MENHTERGELFMEVRLGHCTKDGNDPCRFCVNIPSFIAPSPKPYPDYLALPKYKYCDLMSTPTEDRITDDFLPRAHLKDLFKKHQISSSNQEKINAFADKYIVDAKLIVSYVKHLELLEIKKKKWAEKKAAKNKATPLEPESSDDSSDEDEEIISGILVSDTDSEEDTPIPPQRRSTRTTYATRQFYGHP